MANKSLKVNFDLDHTTKNFLVYKEVSKGGIEVSREEILVGKIYLRKETNVGKENYKYITITIEESE